MSVWQGSNITIPNTLVDLTAETSSSSSSSSSSSTTLPQSSESQFASTSTSSPPLASPGPGRKRTRRGSRPTMTDTEAAWTTTPRMNLTDDHFISAAPSENSNSVPASEKPLRLSTLTCVICLQPPTELTATICGESSSYI